MSIFKRNKPEPVKSNKVEMRAEELTPSFFNDALIFGKFSANSPLMITAVYAALSLISNSIATLPVKVKQKKDNKTDEIDHPVSKLFYDTLLSKFTLMKKLTWDLLVNGNAFMYIVRNKQGNPESLVYLEPGDVTIDYNKQKGTLKYGITNHEGIRKSVNYKDVLHFAQNTRDGIHGRGFLYFGADILKLCGYTQDAASDFFSSGCNIKGILSFKHQVRDEQKTKIREQWNSIHGGNTGSGIAVLEGDTEFIPVSQNGAESQMLETRQFNVVEIARLFNISPVLLGDLSHTNYSSIEDARLDFIINCLLPIIQIYESEINRKLLGNSQIYHIDLDESVLMVADKSTTANYLQTLVGAGIITINEARRILGFNDVDDGDRLIIPYTDINMNTIAELDENVQKQSEEKTSEEGEEKE